MSSKIYKPKLKSGKETKTYFINCRFNGRRYQRSLGVTRYEEADRIKRNMDRLLEDQRDPDILFGKVKDISGENITLNEFEKKFIDYYEVRLREKERKGYSPDTVDAY